MNDVLITIDIDWAPDFMIDFVAEQLVANEVRATWLSTHACAAVDRLGRYPELFEIGIHPNFAPGSTHGATPSEVLAHCLELVPDATTCRAHGLIQSSSLLALLLTETAITTDLSVFLPNVEHLAPVPYCMGGRTMYRLPYRWEDDYEFAQASPSWSLDPHLDTHPGVKVFNFHPIHVYLNSCAIEPYLELKARSGSIAGATREAADRLVRAGSGTQTFFRELVDHLRATGGGSLARDVTARAAAVTSGRTS